MGEIIIKGLRVFGFYGVNAEEKENGQFFEIDINATVNMDKACLSDSIDDTVSYAAVIKTIKRLMAAGKDNLLERAAYRIAEGIMLEYQSIDNLSITLKKPDAPIKADFDYVGVKLSFNRNELFSDDDNDELNIKANAPFQPYKTGADYAPQVSSIFTHAPGDDIR